MELNELFVDVALVGVPTVQGVYLDKSDAADGFNAFVRRVNVQLAKPNPV